MPFLQGPGNPTRVIESSGKPECFARVDFLTTFAWKTWVERLQLELDDDFSCACGNGFGDDFVVTLPETNMAPENTWLKH